MAYTAPTPADLKARYPAFASVLDATIQIYLDQANGGDVDESWFERDFSPAIQAAAAHRMARAGVLGSGAIDASAGIDSFKSGAMSVQFNADAVKASVAGGWGSTPYGQQYAELLARNKAGPRVSGGGCLGGMNVGFNGYAGPLPNLPWFG